MRLSREKLLAEAEATGFRAEILEKVAHLLGLLDAFRSHPFLGSRLVLKGGTALNVFLLDVPRLSVDIDFNYVGAPDRETMLAERPRVEQAMHAVLSREGFSVRRMPSEHAGGKWQLRYPSAVAQTGNLEIDVNFMLRVPLWPVARVGSRAVGSLRASEIPVLDVHELAAGKLAALLSRRQARDLFDTVQIFRLDQLEPEKLRLAFVVYGAMNRKDWRAVGLGDIDVDVEELARQLMPTLRGRNARGGGDAPVLGAQLVEECRHALSGLLPLREHELAFLDRLLDHGEIEPARLTRDPELQQRIERQPLLAWKVINLRRHREQPRGPGVAGT